MEDLYHVIEAPDDVIAEQTLSERSWTRDTALQNAEEMSGDVSIEERRALCRVQRQEIVDVANEFRLSCLTVDDLLPFRWVGIVVKPINVLFGARRIKLWTEAVE